MFDHAKLWLTAGPLTLTSSIIYPHSADITLSFMLNYGVNRFQVSFLTVLSWNLLLLVRRVSQRPTVKIHPHFWFSPPLTSHSFFTQKCTEPFIGKCSNQKSLANKTIVCGLQMSDTTNWPPRKCYSHQPWFSLLHRIMLKSIYWNISTWKRILNSQ